MGGLCCKLECQCNPQAFCEKIKKAVCCCTIVKTPAYRQRAAPDSKAQEVAGKSNISIQDQEPAKIISSETPQEIEGSRYKLLLLGSGESGKSTFFKRMLMRYGRGYPDEDRERFTDSIHENTIEAMQTLIYESEKTDDEECRIDPSCEDAADYIQDIESDSPITREIARRIHKLWGDEGIQKTFENRAEFQVPDGAAYFFDDVNRLARRGYIPSEQDILRCRDRTTGFTHETLEFESEGVRATFDIYDVGGQKGERKKWVKIFKGVNAVFFVVAMSEFDLNLFEDGTTNRLNDSLEVFHMVINSRHFKNVPIVLLFNKIDLFTDKLENNVVFDFGGYDGDQDYESITGYVQDLFEEKNENPDKAIITRFVSAIDDTFSLDEVLSQVVEENTN